MIMAGENGKPLILTDGLKIFWIWARKERGNFLKKRVLGQNRRDKR